MPKKIDEHIYILSPTRAYLAAVGIMGPIVHPLNVAKSSAVKLLMSGAEVHEYDPKTKKTIRLTFENIKEENRFAKEVIAEPIEPKVIEPIVKPGVPINTPIEEESSKEVVEDESPIEEAEEINTEAEFTMPEFIIENGKVNESNIEWSKYTKAQRKEIRNKINELNNTQK